MTRWAVIPLFLGVVAAPALASAAIGTTAVDRSTRSLGDQMSTALNLLEAKGYARFSGFKAEGNHFVARVSQDGGQFDVDIDPESGQVTRAG